MAPADLREPFLKQEFFMKRMLCFLLPLCLLLDAWGFRCCGQSPGADALRWGNLRLEGGEYIFLPCESAVSALSPDA